MSSFYSLIIFSKSSLIPKFKTLKDRRPYLVSPLVLIISQYFFLRFLFFYCQSVHLIFFLSDLGGDGDFRLVIADLGSGEFNMKLRVFKGTQQVCVISGYTRELSRFV